ncbi:hypothetical protein C3B54_111311 [Pontimonas salivibrio]|uniref:Uncharacterized protein n=1 Tax=Pontimonas salivibrio TaxID=1159327 RepID=A0A2L2BRK1_9MICO|nr:hypothetical protein [Pontimonas salivibrio]AVG24257.1 hypothetical protein C3B54_111311 [Pontimonas salivibrio]
MDEDKDGWTILFGSVARGDNRLEGCPAILESSSPGRFVLTLHVPGALLPVLGEMGEDQDSLNTDESVEISNPDGRWALFGLQFKSAKGSLGTLPARIQYRVAFVVKLAAGIVLTPPLRAVTLSSAIEPLGHLFRVRGFEWEPTLPQKTVAIKPNIVIADWGFQDFQLALVHESRFRVAANVLSVTGSVRFKSSATEDVPLQLHLDRKQEFLALLRVALGEDVSVQSQVIGLQDESQTFDLWTHDQSSGASGENPSEEPPKRLPIDFPKIGVDNFARWHGKYDEFRRPIEAISSLYAGKRVAYIEHTLLSAFIALESLANILSNPKARTANGKSKEWAAFDIYRLFSEAPIPYEEWNIDRATLACFMPKTHNSLKHHRENRFMDTDALVLAGSVAVGLSRFLLLKHVLGLSPDSIGLYGLREFRVARALMKTAFAEIEDYKTGRKGAECVGCLSAQ